MIKQIPFIVRNPLFIGLLADGLSLGMETGTEPSVMVLKSHDVLSSNQESRNTLGDMDDLIIGTLDPYEVGDISST